MSRVLGSVVTHWVNKVVNKVVNGKHWQVCECASRSRCFSYGPRSHPVTEVTFFLTLYYISPISRVLKAKKCHSDKTFSRQVP